MITLQSFNGETVYLSDETYELSDDRHPSYHYKTGAVVRLISSVNGSNVPGYHFSNGYVTVCRVDAEIAEFVGVLRSSLRKL